MHSQRADFYPDTPFAFRQGVVIGSGIAGLTAARVLANHVGRVIVVERDHRPDDAGARPGVPQAHHPHNLQPQGQQILEQLYPGVTRELADAHAIQLDGPGDVAFHYEGAWRTPRSGGRHATISCSRRLLEETISLRTFANRRIEIMHGYEVAGLYQQTEGRRVGGVHLQPRRGTIGVELDLDANLVVDASGRRSRAPQWLAGLGYRPPEEWHIDALVGYASRLYRRPPGFSESWKMLYIRPTPPAGTRGGVILPMEGERWHVALMGVGGDYPPTDETGFLAFARSLPAQALYEAIKAAEPLDRIRGFRSTDNRVRRYDTLPRSLEGFLVIGDATYALNPLYAQGMTAALLSAQALAAAFQNHPGRETGDVQELARAFQGRLREAVAAPWRLATRIDWQWEATQIEDNLETLPG